MIKTTVTDVQKAKDDIRKALESFVTDKVVTVGIHDDAGSHSDSDETNAGIGAKLHFGDDSSNIPPRPWLDTGVESGNAEYAGIIQSAVESGESLDQALNAVGVVAVGKVQVYMTELKTPPNALSTIKIKGSNNPLIDTGELRQSVTYKVQKTTLEEGIG